MRAVAISWALLAGIAAGAGSGCTGGNSGQTSATNYKTRADMIAPLTCATCHEQHFDEWSQSMHAKAADDPVFLAMNARGQRETKGKLGTFCVECHAPMAVRDGKTDGRNLGSLDPNYKGVTCYFCHSIDGVEADGGKSNASVHLADDLAMRGEIPDPVANPVHASKYSAFQDEGRPESAEMCGYCHDIDSPAGGHIERTFADWSVTPFGTAGNMGGLTCAATGTCHMQDTPGVPIALGGPKNRTHHKHDFPAVDVPLGAKPPDPALVKSVQDALDDNVLVAALCVTNPNPAIRVILDNTAGHPWPSGAAQDRRAWIEVVAYRADQSVLYSSGVVPAGTPVTEIKDPDLWLLRDCMFDSQGKETHNFWEAATTNGYELPAILTNPSFKNHIERPFPTAMNPLYPQGVLGEMPVKVTLRVLIQPVGLDVLNDLVDSGDLDPGPDGAVLANMPTFEVALVHPLAPGPPLGMEWPAPTDQVAQGLVVSVPFADIDTGIAPNVGRGTCTASTMNLAIPQAIGGTAATCKAPP